MNDAVAYFDHAASAPMVPEAVEAMLPWLGAHAANPSGTHRAARAARRAVDDARERLAEIVGVAPVDVVFTSGGTEADNLAVSGRFEAVGGVVCCSAVEHPAVLEPVLGVGGATVAVGADGVVDLEALAAALDERRPSLVSVMTVNNELGVVQPIGAVAELVRSQAPDAVLHTDAVQALTWLDLRPVGGAVDAMSLSAHKFGGPQGVGALTVRAGTRLAPRQLGGGQEHERRSGTHNVAGIVAMAAAAHVADRDRAATVERVGARRDRLVHALVDRLDGVVETVALGARRPPTIAGIAHLCVEGVDSEALLFLLDEAGVCASAASACASGAQQRSHVLAAMGVDDELVRGSLRLSLGPSTSDDDVERCIDAVVVAVERLRTYPR